MSALEPLAVDPEKAFLDSLPVIDRVIAIIARRHGLPRADAEEFTAWARARIIDGDYAIIRKFAGRSSLPTYLSVVLTNLFRDYRNSAWGRWRPSAAATRLGPVGIRLEELLYRDGCSVRESVGVLRSAGVALTVGELADLAVRIPQRQPTKEVGLEELNVAGAAADSAVDSASFEENGEIASSLRAVVEELSPEDQIITRMRFWSDVSVADIARTLGLEQKPLYRRLESIQERLRTLLAARGIDRERALDVLAGEARW